ncbi:hypothetical protein ACJQWK_01756 [Exserohilum turcicum]
MSVWPKEKSPSRLFYGIPWLTQAGYVWFLSLCDSSIQSFSQSPYSFKNKGYKSPNTSLLGQRRIRTRVMSPPHHIPSFLLSFLIVCRLQYEDVGEKYERDICVGYVAGKIVGFFLFLNAYSQLVLGPPSSVA